VVSSALSDEALLSGLAAGDADAATAFTRRFQARVYGLVLTIVRDEGTAEDVAQETFVRAWRHARTYDPRRGRVATWLLTIARNLAIDVIRVKSAEPARPAAPRTRAPRRTSVSASGPRSASCHRSSDGRFSSPPISAAPPRRSAS
jgi:RNA polymerase sigma factor (sigma-70 family)